ncbi:MAG: hypothetical protein M3297_12315 [Thermoproteota archaeon]|nr:hypothetical protein [Thermoproteota archaeon]
MISCKGYFVSAFIIAGLLVISFTRGTMIKAIESPNSAIDPSTYTYPPDGWYR